MRLDRVTLISDPRDRSLGNPIFYNATKDIVYVGSKGAHHYMLGEKIPDFSWADDWYEAALVDGDFYWYVDPPAKSNQVVDLLRQAGYQIDTVE